MRLTSKCDGQYFNNCFPTKIYNKLGQLEDIEEEFEIDDLEDLRERLTTYKFLANHEMSGVDVNAYNLMLKDLDEYHKIEEELGIDLITLCKALKNGIWVKENISENQYLLSHYITYISNRSYGFVCIEYDFVSYYEVYLGNIRKEMNFYLKDYGKTWALAREELDGNKKIN